MTSETDIHQVLTYSHTKQLLFEIDWETPSTTLRLSCGKAVRAQVVLEVINCALHSHFSFISQEIILGQ